MNMSSFRIRLPSGRYRDATPGEVCEAAATYALQRYRESLNGTPLRKPGDGEELLRRAVGGLESEVFGVVFLDNRHRVIDVEILFRGTIDGTNVYPREVVKRSLAKNAAAVILFHNHPSGVAEPSQADERITRRLKAALELVDVRVLDHLVLVRDHHVSFAARNLLGAMTYGGLGGR